MDRELALYLRQLGTTIHTTVNDSLKDEFNINKKEFSVLAILNRDCYEPISQKELAVQIHADRSTMVAVIDSLESEGYIKRIKNPNNRRENLITLTEKGSTLFDQISLKFDEAVNNLFDEIDEKDIEVFTRVLKSIIGEIDESQPS